MKPTPLAVGTRFTAVEFPGNVVNVPRALGMLGGEARISQALADESRFIELRFRGPEASPIYGDRIATSNLLLRVTVSKRKKAIIRSDIVGVVTVTYRFKGMADFQVLPPRVRPEADAMLGFERDQPLHLLPPVFSREDIPRDYGFRDNPQFHLAKDPEGRLHFTGSAPTRVKQATAQHDDSRIPAGSGGAVPADLAALVTHLKQLFDGRPMWSPLALRAKLTADEARKLKLALPYVTYLWRTGPFRRAYCRLDYDPRTTAESRHFQTVDFRVAASETVSNRKPTAQGLHPSRKKKELGTVNLDGLLSASNEQPEPAKEKAENEQEHQFLCPPSRCQTLYQLVDIADSNVKQLLQASKVQNTCSERWGWFPRTTIDKVRQVLKFRLAHYLKGEPGDLTADEMQKVNGQPDEDEEEEAAEAEAPSLSRKEREAVKEHASANKAARAQVSDLAAQLGLDDDDVEPYAIAEGDDSDEGEEASSLSE